MKTGGWYVVNEEGKPYGPCGAEEITRLVAVWEIGPEAQVRHGMDGEWVPLWRVALRLGIELPGKNAWRQRRAQAKSAARWRPVKWMLIGMVLVFFVMKLFGAGFLFMPLALWLLTYWLLAALFGAMSGKDVLCAPLWLDLREKPAPGALWQFAAMALAAVLIAGFRVWRLYH